MEQLIAPVISALKQAGLPAVAALPNATAPRLKGAACAVSLGTAEGCEAGLYRYLGLQESENGPLEIYGKRLEAELSIQVFSPVSQGGSGCLAAVGKAAEVLLNGIEPLSVGKFTVGCCSYDGVSDCFVCTLKAKVGALAYAVLNDDGTIFTDFTLKGEML